MREHSQQLEIAWEERYPDLRPGVLYFECGRLCAHITNETCRQNWLQATNTRPDPEQPSRFAKCRSCPIGLHLHTDVDAPLTWRDVRAESECVRCGRRGIRIITSTGECASCFNRRRETERGRNARGRPPMFPTIMTPRRVGLVIDGKSAWRRFDSANPAEAITRAIRQVDGAQFHDEQPGNVVWNPKLPRYQYRCQKHPGEFGTLRELVADDGSVEYICPVCAPGRAKGLPEATVTTSTSIKPFGFVSELANVIDYENVDGEWVGTEHICDRCQHYPLEVRRRNGRTESRCPMCDG